MVLRSADALDFPVADSDLESTGVRAIHCTGGANNLAGHYEIPELCRR